MLETPRECFARLVRADFQKLAFTSSLSTNYLTLNGIEIDSMFDGIEKYHRAGLNLDDMFCALFREYNYPFDKQTLHNHLVAIGLEDLKDDLDLGWAKLDQVIEEIRELCKDPQAGQGGYQWMRLMLSRQYGHRVDGPTVSMLMSKLSSFNLAIHERWGALASSTMMQGPQYKIIHPAGPNHLWSSGANFALDPFGISLYGFVDVWSGRVLGIFVHTRKHDPRHIGLCYLKTVQSIGGFPLQTTSDRDMEAVEMIRHQTNLLCEFKNDSEPTLRESHIYSNGISDQRIISTWSQLTRHHNHTLIDELNAAIGEGRYDPKKPVERLAFLYLGVPLIQRSINDWIRYYNSSTRRSVQADWLTGYTANWCYDNPSIFDCRDGLTMVEKDTIKKLEQEHYSDINSTQDFIPSWFSVSLSSIFKAFSINFNSDSITFQTLWKKFDELMILINAYDFNWVNVLKNDHRGTFAFKAQEQRS
ncbi:hypothetical protein O181_000290 [Austropuccinia psidii MF-1]|uniref:Integrase core domain-containing protein n=1 Tax=Austropuccinia psidii MF-1 TaxID=1389203 RepID=A0A9Q3B8Q6_9BASI|nr:hypothetical protein [Austropuccinia psidii MF-1]